MHLRCRCSLGLLLALLLPLPGFASAYNASPKLIVVVIIDQFRGDYLERDRDKFGPGGFRLFLDRGAVFSNCQYDYANTRTGPGHATLVTGAYSNGHGIPGNEWWDSASNSVIDSVADPKTTITGPAGSGGTGASPRHLLADTLGDELKLATAGKGRVFAISLKDRAAILSAGFAADGAYWIDHKSGAFISSSYYAGELPAWVKTLDSGGQADKYWNREWKDSAGKVLRTTARPTLPDGRPDPKAGFYEVVGSTPFGTDYELDFARALITQEKLGRGEATDLLIVSLSPHDILGHEAGPDDPRIKAMTLALDRQLAEFFRYLDQQLGLANIWIALSSDHGVAPLPAYAEKFRLPAVAFKPALLREAANKELATRFPKLGGPGIARMVWPFAYLSAESFAAANISQPEAERAAGEVLMRLAGWQSFFTRSQLAEGRVPADENGRMFAHSYSPYGGWYVLGQPAPFTMGFAPTDHSTGYSYDTHVPLAFFGAVFAPGIYRGRSEPVDLAVTLASLLGINAPSHAVGRVLTEALADQRPARASVQTATPTPRSQPSR